MVTFTDVVDLQGEHLYFDGFCVHVWVQQDMNGKLKVYKRVHNTF